MIKYLEKNPQQLYILAVLLIFPALFINLGLMPLRLDGGLRGLISYEMMLSNDYLTPSLNGVMYFNKPPLYNWILILLFKLTGHANEFIIRVPTIISYLLTGLAIYLFLLKETGKEKAFLNAMFYLTGGFMFFGASSVGHIDFTLGLLAYMAIMNIYIQYKKKRLLLLFTISYFLTALGYLIKGYPALAFLGISLIVFFVYNKDWKKLFCWQHFVGIAILLITLGSYYFLYFYHHPGYFNQVFAALLSEVVIKTSVHSTFSKFIIHLLIFPFKLIYNLFPWSLLLIFLFTKNFKAVIAKNPLIKFSIFIFLFNILVYWFSSGTQMKYITAIIPFFYFVCIEFYDRFKDDNRKTKIVHNIFLAVSLIFIIGSIVAPFLQPTSEIKGIVWISIGLVCVLTILTIIYWKSDKIKLPVFIIILMVARIGFNLIVQPVNVSSLPELKLKQDAIAVGKMTTNEHLYTCTLIDENISFYITRQRNKILNRKQDGEYNKKDFYIVNEDQLEDFKARQKRYEIKYYFSHKDNHKDLYLIKFQ